MQVRLQHVDEGGDPVEEALPGERLVHHDAGGVHVGARVELEPADLLRAHVVRRAAHEPGRGELRVVLRLQLRDAEVEHLYVLATRAQRLDEDVLGLEVAVDDAGRMRVVERGKRLAEQLCDARGRQRPLVAHDLRERAAAQHLHDDVQGAGRGLPEVEDGDRVRVVQAAGGARLVLEALRGHRVRGNLRVEHFDRDLRVEAEVHAAVDAAHCAHADQLEQLVLTDERRADERVALFGLDRAHVRTAARAMAVRVPARCRAGRTPFHAGVTVTRVPLGSSVNMLSAGLP